MVFRLWTVSGATKGRRENEGLVATDAASPRLERAHHAVAAVDAGDDFIRPLADGVADPCFDVVIVRNVTDGSLSSNGSAFS